MKKAVKIVIFVLILAVVFTIVPATLFADAHARHPKGPDTMPAQSLNGTHKAIFQVPSGSIADHVIFGLMFRTGPCHN